MGWKYQINKESIRQLFKEHAQEMTIMMDEQDTEDLPVLFEEDFVRAIVEILESNSGEYVKWQKYMIQIEEDYNGK